MSDARSTNSFLGFVPAMVIDYMKNLQEKMKYPSI